MLLAAISALIGALSADDPELPRGQSSDLPIPAAAVDAYVAAQSSLTGCSGLSWTVLAGVGAVESGHGAGSRLSETGQVEPGIIGARLDGSGVGGNVTPYYDTDGGDLDGDVEFDRAVGPMQFLPETWDRWGQDGNGDGVRDPQNLYDAALATATYLCGDSGIDLGDRELLIQRLLVYNNSQTYVANVLAQADRYEATL